MPSKSTKQAKLMAAVAHNPKFAKKVKIPQKVGKDFNNADISKGYVSGGSASKNEQNALSKPRKDTDMKKKPVVVVKKKSPYGKK